MDRAVVAQATTPEFTADAEQPEHENLVTVVRMEIGGIRFVMPLSDITAVIEPTAMEAHTGDPDGIWIGNVGSHQGAITIASGCALLQTDATPPGRIAILHGENAVGLAVDRMLSAETVRREAIYRLPGAIPVAWNSPVSAAIWSSDDRLELMLDRDILLSKLDPGFYQSSGQTIEDHQSQQLMVDRYGKANYRQAIEVRFDASSERWVIPMSSVRLVTDSRQPHPFPHSPEKVQGLVSWQRQPIPVIDPSYSAGLPRPVSLPAKFVVVGEPASIGQTSVQADAALLVDGIVGIHDNLRIEHGYAWDAAGDALNLVNLTDILS